MAVGEEDVRRFDVAVYEAVAVRVVERGTDLGSDSDRVVNRERLLAIESIAKRAAWNERRDVVQYAVRFAGIYERHDVRMGETGRDPNLSQKTRCADGGAQLPSENLYGDLAPMLSLFGEVHGCHAALAEHALDGITIAEHLADRDR